MAYSPARALPSSPAHPSFWRRLSDGSLPALLPIALATVVFFPITRNYFYQDDFLHLYRIVNRGVLELLVTPHGGHILVVRNAVFWLFYQLFGTAAADYFAAVLLTHLLNVYLLYAVIRTESGNIPLACFGAALWGTCRMHEGALGWYSVYGQVLVGTCLLWVLYRLNQTAAGVPMARHAWLRWTIVLLLGTTCFGLGLAVALVSPLLAWLLLPPSQARTVTVRAFGALALATPVLYVGTQWLYAALYAGVSEIPEGTSVIHSAGVIAAVTAELALAGISGLCLGSFSEAATYSTSLLVGGIVAVGVLVVALRSRGPTRSRVAAYLILALACYGSIAVGRAAPLHRVPAAAGAPRYHYVALLPATLLVCELVGAATGLLGALQAPVLIVAALATPALAWQPRRLPLYDPTPARQETQQIMARIRARAAVPSDAPMCLPNQAFGSLDGRVLPNLRLEFPGWAAVYAIFEPDDTIAGRHIYFIERNREVLQTAPRGRRSASLIVAPDRAAALGCGESF